MANNRIVIGNGKEKDNEETKPVLKDTVVRIPITAPNTKQAPVQEPLDENLWGNDYTIINKLNEKQLADRRMFVRVLYMQKIECNTTLDKLETEPTLLTKPITFMIIDISIAGIGIVCEYEISIGTILAFKLTLDNISYEIKCKVVYCSQNDDKFRAGLEIVEKDKQFIKHLKILVARISLQSKYGTMTDKCK